MPSTNTSFNFNYYPSPTLPASIAFPLFLIAAALVIAGLLLLAYGRRREKGYGTIIGAFAMAGGIAVALITFYKATVQNLPIPVFAPKSMLSSLWENYKKDFIEPVSERTVDPARQNVTTSEGEGYTMLRAAWMDDQPTFDASWHWTQKNLQHSNDHLFSWLYGTQPNGTKGVLTAVGGDHSASDADTDIALALVFAYSRWQDPRYLNAALPIIADIWKKEVVIAGGKPVLTAGDASAASPQMTVVNPSYFSPYAYRIFAVLDRSHNWMGLVDSSYQLLDESMAAPLDQSTSAGLPPDWIAVNANGAIAAPPQNSGETTNFGYDALRVPWRIALDWAWNGDPRAKAALDRMGFLGKTWAENGTLDAVYAHDGTTVGAYQSPAMYGGTMGYFLVSDPSAAQAVYLTKLQSLYNPDTETWKLPLSYYDANIAWFGMALYNHSLPDLFLLNAAGGAAGTSTAP